MKKFYLILVMITAYSLTKAQTYVTVPDSNFVSWLTVNIPSAMSGNQMNITDPSVTSMTSMNVSNDSIFDLNGIQYFTSLQSLNCSENQLDSISGLPASLLFFDCSYNYTIRFIDSLPSSLQYFQCLMNKLTALPPLPASLLSMDCRENQLVTLPALPPAMPFLICSYNLITSLPGLPSAITHIECETNEMNSLPALPPGLTYLSCGNNLLTVLPTLPITLDSLYCSVNSLTSFSSMPSLIVLDCSQNMLSGLPSLPYSLQYLTCDGNPLGTLPSLPAGLLNLSCNSDSLAILPSLPGTLNSLSCNDNQLTFMPALPGTLTYLSCNRNDLTWLPVLPASLNELDCSYNQIPVMPALSNLVRLYCNSNLLNTVPTIPPTLQSLACGYNPLDSLPALNSIISLTCNDATLDSLPALPATLTSLYCANNQLTVLPALPSALHLLNCDANLLTQIPTIPAALSELSCSYNQLSSLPVIPSSLDMLFCTDNLISCMPEFPDSMSQLVIYNNPFTCLQNYIPAMDSITLLKPLCVLGDLVIDPYNCPSARGLVGFTYNDLDSNCIMDSTDNHMTNIPMKIYDNTGTLIGQTYTAVNGVYDFVEPAGTYTAVVDTAGLPFVAQCSTPGIDSTAVITALSPLADSINFSLECKPGFDVGVQSIIHLERAFPGTQHELEIVAGDMSQWYHMHCAAGLSGVVQVKVIGPVSYLGPATGALTPIVTGSMYTYMIPDFGAISDTHAFRMNFLTDSTAIGHDVITVITSVTPVGGDNDTSNNTWIYHYIVTNSHDPNYKETTPEIVTPAYDDYFTYTVHFQNTGNAPAHNIAVADTLDNNLDPSTFQLINFSHDNNVSITGNYLHISFPNIMLSDSASSADSSMGFFQYRIKAKKSRPMGTHIYNTAYIYFDYNEPVVTNTTINMYEGSTPMSVNNIQNNSDWNIYPNPASDHIFIGNAGKDVTLIIADVTGRIVSKRSHVNGNVQIETSSFETGLYFITLIENDHSSTKKFVKQ